MGLVDLTYFKLTSHVQCVHCVLMEQRVEEAKIEVCMSLTTLKVKINNL